MDKKGLSPSKSFSKVSVTIRNMFLGKITVEPKPDLHGKNVERRRESDDWFYRFKAGRKSSRGSCGTTDKSEAEAMAARLKQRKPGGRPGPPTAAAMTALGKVPPGIPTLSDYWQCNEAL